MATLQDTLAILECPICLECPETKPIYQCDKGHVHCNKCHDNIEHCPVCRSTFIEIRALVAEQILERSLPCDLEVTLKDLSEHGKLHGVKTSSGGILKHVCNICKKEFSNQQLLYFHQKVHQFERPRNQ